MREALSILCAGGRGGEAVGSSVESNGILVGVL